MITDDSGNDVDAVEGCFNAVCSYCFAERARRECSSPSGRIYIGRSYSESSCDIRWVDFHAMAVITHTDTHTHALPFGGYADPDLRQWLWSSYSPVDSNYLSRTSAVNPNRVVLVQCHLVLILINVLSRPVTLSQHSRSRLSAPPKQASRFGLQRFVR